MEEEPDSKDVIVFTEDLPTLNLIENAVSLNEQDEHHVFDGHAAIHCKKEIIIEPTASIIDMDGFEDMRIANEDSSPIKIEIHEDQQINNDQQENFTDHVSSKKRTPASFQCDYCQRVFIKKLNISKHMKCHMAEISCSKCQGKFTEKHKYLLHISTVHPGSKNHKCTLCPKCK